MRDLAKAVRIETASLYYQYPSKQEILLDLFNRTMDALVDGLERAACHGEAPVIGRRSAPRPACCASPRYSSSGSTEAHAAGSSFQMRGSLSM